MEHLKIPIGEPQIVRQHNLLQVGGTAYTLARRFAFARAGNTAGENCDDCDHYEQFNQGEARQFLLRYDFILIFF
jgi:hypothetical protein